MVSRIAVAQSPRAPPADLREWQYLDRSAPVWAIRHYRPDRVGADPTIEMLLGGKDPKATGLAVEFGIDGATTARMLAKSDLFRHPWRRSAPQTAQPQRPQASNTRVNGTFGVWTYELL